jgi:hypothetical protein
MNIYIEKILSYVMPKKKTERKETPKRKTTIDDDLVYDRIRKGLYETMEEIDKDSNSLGMFCSNADYVVDKCNKERLEHEKEAEFYEQTIAKNKGLSYSQSLPNVVYMFSTAVLKAENKLNKTNDTL